MTLLDSAIDDFLRLTADYRTGLAWCSAEKIRALCPRGIGLRDIQRSLVRLVALGRIKRFQKPGKRGNYPIVCGHYFVRDVSLNWYRVNLEKTIDWRQIQYDSVTDPSELASEAVTRLGTDVSPEMDSSVTRNGTEVTPLKKEEGESENREKGNESDPKHESDRNYKNGSREIEKKQPVAGADAISNAFGDWDFPKDGVLRIGPDLLASLHVDAARLREDEKCGAALRNMQKAWNRAWKDISTAADVVAFLENAKVRSSKTRMWIDPVFFARCGQIERGELKVST